MAHKRKYDYTVGVRPQGRNESDADYYRYMARLADKRLSRLEGYKGDKYFGGILKYAYRNAQYDIESFKGEGSNKRFGVKIPKTSTGEIDIHELRARSNAVKRFLESPTSTKQGTIEVYQKRADSVNKNPAFGNTEFTWEDLANFYESDFNELTDHKYGSSTQIKALGAIRRIKWDDAKIQAAKDGNLKLSNDEAVDEMAIDMIVNGLDPREIFKSVKEG